MDSKRIRQSVITRLVVSILIGSAVVSLIPALLNANRTTQTRQREVTQMMHLATSNLQHATRWAWTTGSPADLNDALESVASRSHVLAGRLTRDGKAIWRFGDNEAVDYGGMAVWDFRGVAPMGDEISLDGPTLIRAPFNHRGERAILELIVDGGRLQRKLDQLAFEALSLQWFLVGVMTLLGLLLLRRWVAIPLRRIGEMVASHCAPESFRRFARRQKGELGQLAEIIADMLTRIDETAGHLRERDQMLSSLYDGAPVAMVGINEAGVVLEANEEATRLLGASNHGQLPGLDLAKFVRSEDRQVLAAGIGRARLTESASCELAVVVDGETRHVAAKFRAEFDANDELRAIRICLLDVSANRRLHDEMENQSALLNLLIDHMSDAIVLIDRHGQIAAHNQQMSALLHRASDTFAGGRYDCETFWNDLGIVDRDRFVKRIRQIESDLDRPAEERFVTRAGAYRFQGIPVHDIARNYVGRLWVVQEVTSQEQTQRLTELQAQQLLVLRKLGQAMADRHTVEALLHAALELLYPAFGVDTVGIALRGGERRRVYQIIHRGDGAYPLESTRDLVDVFESQVMPQMLSQSEPTHWPELPSKAGWSRAFERAGLSSLAGTVLEGTSGTQGVLWIGRRGGQRIERHDIYLLETIAPLLAARIEIAQLEARMSELDLVDALTHLPSRSQFDLAMAKLARAAESPWTVVAVEVRGADETLPTTGEQIQSDDATINAVARKLIACVRKDVFVARTDIRRLALILPDCARAGAVRVVDRLKSALAEVLAEGGVIAGLGFAVHGEDADDPDALFQAAARLAGDQVQSAGASQAPDAFIPDRLAG